LRSGERLSPGAWRLNLLSTFRNIAAFLDSWRRRREIGPCYQRSSRSRLWPSKCLFTRVTNKILIVDDDDQLVSAYLDYLTQLGYAVDTAGEIEEAQTLLSHFQYGLVITDLRLSRLNFGGLELVKFIRNAALPTRVIVLTAYGWPELKAEAVNEGVDVFLRKPMRLSDLAKNVAVLSGGSA
jgi:CheY-like chemotaxis protein